MFASIVCTITGTKFQINPLTVTLFSGSWPESPLPRSWRNLKMPLVIGLILTYGTSKKVISGSLGHPVLP